MIRLRSLTTALCAAIALIAAVMAAQQAPERSRAGCESHLHGAKILRGGPAAECIRGSRRADKIRGGGGADNIYGGAGRDRIFSADSLPDRVDCGRGKRDRARADRSDKLRRCERVRYASRASSGGKPQKTAELSVTLSGSGKGRVSSTGISCPSDCSEQLPLKTKITLTASPAAGSSFAGWSGSCAAAGAASTCDLTMSQARDVGAAFELKPPPTPATASLLVTTAGTGSGVVSSPAGISCPTDCTEEIAAGALVTLTATPAAGSEFAGWGGSCAAAGSAPTCALTLSEARWATALFNLIPEPPDPLELGISVGGGLQNEDATTLGKDFAAMSDLGSEWVRIDINWAQVQRDGPTSYDWSSIDRVVQAARSRGMDVSAGILYTPGWARPSGTQATHGPNPDQYAAFAKTAVARYAAMGVHTYEVWNEPNSPAFWTPAPNRAAYTALLKKAYPAIKSADPSATVLTGGTAPAPSDGTSFSPVDWLQGIYANGGKAYFDAVSHHPYCWPAYPGDAQGWSAWYQMYGTTPSLRSVMSANNDSAKKIWATEYGAPTSGPAGSFVSETAQAYMIATAITEWKSYGWAGPLFVYQARDQGVQTTTRENFFGLSRFDFSPKPSYNVFKNLAAAN